MARTICIIDGHPDASRERLCHALTQSYADGAEAGGHKVTQITLADIDVPLLRSVEEFERGTPGPAVRQWQQEIAKADHLVFIYPLWLGSMPALLKAFLEQVMRPGFAVAEGSRSMHPGLLKGKSARIVVTMGMPAWFYRWFFFAHSLKSLERHILRFVGIGPIRETLIGAAGGDAQARTRWLELLHALGRQGG